MEDYFDWTKEIFDPDKIFSKPEALEGVRVLEICTRVFGPMTAEFLAEFGAEVIKIELPGDGDLMRYTAPLGRFWKDVAVSFFPMNRNKYFVGLDIRKPEGKELFYKLVARSDVVVENFKAGTMDRWGTGYRQLREINPAIIYVANSGFGQWGPNVERPSYDATAQAEAGLAAITGFPSRPPLKVPIYIGDTLGALHAAIGVLVALYRRHLTGKGEFIDVSQGESLLRTMDWTFLFQFLIGSPDGRPRWGNYDPAICPAGIFRCRDGYIGVAAQDDEQFKNLCTALKVPELATDPRFIDQTTRTRTENAKALYSTLSEILRHYTAEEIETLAIKYGFAAAKVANAQDIYNDDHYRARRAIVEFDDPIYGTLVDYGPVPKLSETPGRIRWAAKPVGFHNEHVFKKLLGLTDNEISELTAKGVIGQWSDRPGARPPITWDGRTGTGW
jgi:crotonobetainyl-CoA:carnitine CoA-transferase CaiB-like acyl-CoA transferase